MVNLAYFLLATVLVALTLAQTADHPLVGTSGNLVERFHDATGTVVIINDEQFRVDNFAFDGQGVRVHWYASTQPFDINGNFQCNIASGDCFSLVSSENLVTGSSYNSESYTYTLDGGRNWNGIRSISLWCVPVGIDFSSIELPEVAAAPTKAPVANCKSMSDFFNLRWELDLASNSITFEYETAIRLDQWMGFGIADQSLGFSGMVGADVIIVGRVNELPFATDYFLGARRPCESSTVTDAVCPDTVRMGGTSDVIGLEVRGTAETTSFFRFKRPLNKTDDFDRSIDPDAELFVVWARGPLDGDLVRKHPAGETSSTTKIRFSDSVNDCVAVTQAPGTLAPISTVVETIVDTTEIEVTQGNYIVHPNPPGWGFSFKLNGMSTPILYVKRNVTYTFTVKTNLPTMELPFYLTDDTVGGQGVGAAMKQNPIVYAGFNGSISGSPTDPYVFQWTPDDSTPDLLYYQCWSATKQGWQIVVDQEPTPTTVAPASTSVEPTSTTVAPSTSIAPSNTNSPAVDPNASASPALVYALAFVVSIIALLL